MKLVTEIYVSELLASLWRVAIVVLMVVLFSVLSVIDSQNSEQSSGSTLMFPSGSIQFIESTQKASGSLTICEESREEGCSDCCIHCCGCQIYLCTDSPTPMNSNDGSIALKRISNVFLEGLISVPFRPPKT